MRFLLIPVGVLLLANALPANAQELKGGRRVLARVPLSVFDTIIPREYRSDARVGQKGLFARVSATPAGATVNGRSAWHEADFPELVPRSVGVIKRKKKEGETIISLKREDAPTIVLVIPTADEPRLWSSIAADTSAGEELVQLALPALRARYFTGPLDSISVQSKDRLLVYFRPYGGFDVEEFKGQRYLHLSLSSADVVYNTLKLSESARVADQVRTRLLDMLKSFAPIAGELPEGFGLKVSLPIYFRDFSSYRSATADQVEFFVPLEAIRAFSEADITSQDLMNRSIVLVNGNRTEVLLSER
jgi:hypothetical protein